MPPKTGSPNQLHAKLGKHIGSLPEFFEHYAVTRHRGDGGLQVFGTKCLQHCAMRSSNCCQGHRNVFSSESKELDGTRLYAKHNARPIQYLRISRSHKLVSVFVLTSEFSLTKPSACAAEVRAPSSVARPCRPSMSSQPQRLAGTNSSLPGPTRVRLKGQSESRRLAQQGGPSSPNLFSRRTAFNSSPALQLLSGSTSCPSLRRLDCSTTEALRVASTLFTLTTLPTLHEFK